MAATVYLDESGTHQGSDVLCVAGFVFLDDHAAQLHKDLAAIYARRGISHMHMAEYTKPGHKRYAHVPPDALYRTYTEIIQAIQKHRSLAVACSFNEHDCLEAWRETKFQQVDSERFSAYKMCLSRCMSQIVRWNSRYKWIEGPVSYYFEAGHRDAAIVQELWNEVRMYADIRDLYQYKTHEFRDKREDNALQAADMLAWLVRNWMERYRRSPSDADCASLKRKDLVALTEPSLPQHGRSLALYPKQQLQRIYAEIKAYALTQPVPPRSPLVVASGD